ncbi:hypothetical protein [Corallococcus llansteffanensis]|uniref:Cytochrome c domain-containing protein n=1 Tax=Corallococcus llansteffanensis TaxID=2316731 RepID=A0A3A8NUV0_9BACT|nr:hypothetical protein [Corallococcus llansteffanensis]RKH44935.1 hypothetical protein D7V93_35845 [Corallococcus llansteffanensis]
MRLRSCRRLALTGLVLLATGCMTGPLNGTTTEAQPQGKEFVFQGYHNQPAIPIQVQVLKDAEADPALAANWVVIANTVTSTTASYYNSPDPLYAWSVKGTPVTAPANAARWPVGGVLRVRALAKDPDGDRLLTTFDDVTFSDCLGEHAGEEWSQVGAACEGMGIQTASVVSTLLSPVDAATPPDYLGRKGTISVKETGDYYKQINAPDTFALFLSTYGFDGTEDTATYFNEGDLGIGREMHCKPINSGRGTACYVKNYAARDANNKPIFGGDSNAALADAVARTNAFATVAMVYMPPREAPNSVKFMVYDGVGKLSPTAVLDNQGKRVSIPNNCLSCHGVNANYDAGSKSVSGASFLPFDVFSFRYSSAPGFTFAAQADALRRLNARVLLTKPAKGITDFINGTYAPHAASDPAAVANDTYVPVGWTTTRKHGVGLYKGVVKQYCRTCHMSANHADDAGLAAYDFLESADFDFFKSAIKADVCDPSHQMPQAEHVMKKMWKSGARGYLVTGLNLQTACKP